MPSVCCLPVSPFILRFVHPLQDVSFYQYLSLSSVAFLFHLSPKLCPSTAGCIVLSVPFIALCLLPSCFTFHQSFVHPLQDVSFYQYLSLPSVCCIPVSPFTKALSIHCRMYRSINTFHCPLSVAFLFHLSPRLCPSTAGCIVLSVPFIVLCCLPVSPFTKALSIHCRMHRSISTFHCPLLPSCFTFNLRFVHPLQDVSFYQCLSLSFVAFLFHLSPRLCPSTAGLIAP